MSTEIARAQPVAHSLPDMVRYADHLANANLLPAQYRQKPANVLYAMEYGRTLGITPLAAITGIHVIEGKPSASSGLIGALVRQAGHKLRVTGNDQKAVAIIVRSDDPDFEYRVEWTIDRARQAGLVNKDVWKKYPAAMLKARAITEVARDACEEVLFGLHYTPEELGAVVDQEGNPVDAPVQPLRAVQAEAAPAQGSIAVDPECLVAEPTAQKIADQAAQAADRGRARELWAVAKTGRVLNAVMAAPDTGEMQMLSDYLKRRAAELPDAPAEDDVQDAEIVPDADPEEAEHAAAEQELRAVAKDLQLDDIDRDAHGALGAPIAEASAHAIRGLTNQLRGVAA